MHKETTHFAEGDAAAAGAMAEPQGPEEHIVQGFIMYNNIKMNNKNISTGNIMIGVTTGIKKRQSRQK